MMLRFFLAPAKGTPSAADHSIVFTLLRRFRADSPGRSIPAAITDDAQAFTSSDWLLRVVPSSGSGADPITMPIKSVKRHSLRAELPRRIVSVKVEGFVVTFLTEI
jgi:hypothetical protein